MSKKLRASQRGQALIIIIFILLVVGLIILAASARSLTDVRISETSEDSSRAFSAAEAGVEEAVAQIRTTPVACGATPGSAISLPNNATGNYTIAPQCGDKWMLSPDPLNPDLETFQVYLADSANNFTTGNYTGSSICVLWGDVATPPITPQPAIEISVVYRDTANATRVARFPVDPNAQRRQNGIDGNPANNFLAPSLIGDSCADPTVPDTTNLGVVRSFAYRHELNLATLPQVASNCAGSRCVQLLRTRLLYNSQAQYVGVHPVGGAPLPLQGHMITAAGQVGEAQRKVRVYRSLEALPAIFDFAIFNGSTNPLSK